LAFRRLKDRIDALCAMAIETPDGEELSRIVQELRKAIHEHTQGLRKLAVSIPQPDRRGKDLNLPSARRAERSRSIEPERD
jgi:hypothetical protein